MRSKFIKTISWALLIFISYRASAQSQFNLDNDTKFVLSVGTQVVLPAGANLKAVSSQIDIAGATLTIGGVIAGPGSFTGSSTSNLNLSGATGTVNFTQTSAATRSLNNLTLNSSASATLGNALDVYGTIALTTATLNLNSVNLTLKSNSTGTARIANLTGSTLSGASNVTVERYIKLRTPGTGDGTGNNGRAYRLLAPTVNTSGSIRTNWMETGMNIAIGTNVNPVANHGTQISGAGGNANGFDVTQSNAPSLYATTNAVTPTYTAVGNTTSTLNALTGYFLYIRGDRSMNMQVPLSTNMPTSHTTLRTTGTLVTGTQTTFTNAFVDGGALNLVTNPYASPIDWSLVQPACTNVSTSYTLWDPNVGTRGGFVTVTTGGVVSGGGTATKFIQPGQAFFVQASGGVPTVSIQEGHKAAGNNNTVFLIPPESFETALYFIEDSGYRRMADGVNVLYDNVYSASIDANDATEINNWDENIAVDRESKHLAIEGRPVILTRDTISLFMNNMKQRAYEFDFIPASFTNIGLKAELIDNFLNTRTLLSVLDTVSVNFTVTTDPASAASNRFMIVFGPQGPLAIDVITINAQAKNNGVQVNWTAKTEMDMDRYELEKSFNGTAFTKITTVSSMGNSNVPVNYSWLDANPQKGLNFYRIKAIDKSGLVKYTSIVKVGFGKSHPAFIVSPNPVSGNTINLQLTDIENGTYNLVLINDLGQRIFSTRVQHAGGSAVILLSPLSTLAKGVYEIILTGENIRIINRMIKN